jgi:hypothetical protein
MENKMNSSSILQLADATKFPLRGNSKIPACKWQDEDLPPVREGQNYGIHTGKSGFIVIDLDKHEIDGVEAFRKLCPDNVLPETFAVETPSGGLHLYFKATDDIGRHPNLLGKGIDVLGGEGYVVGPGSVVDGKEYQVINDTDVQDLPRWLKLRITGVAHSGWASGRKGQDDKLSTAVFHMRLAGKSKEDAYKEWLKLVEETGGAKDPSRPWSTSDFERHWKGADRKVSQQEARTGASGGTLTPRKLGVKPLSGVQFKIVQWAWDTTEAGQYEGHGGRLPLGTVCVGAGRPGAGKGQFAAWLAARVSKGELPGCFFGTPKSVLICTTEDSVASTIGPRCGRSPNSPGVVIK